MYYTYILYSAKHDRFYIGYTSNLEDRISRHNGGRERFTKKYVPWEVKYCKEFEDSSSAIKYEKYLKSLKSKKKLRTLCGMLED